MRSSDAAWAATRAASATSFSPRRGAGGDFFEQDRLAGNFQLGMRSRRLLGGDDGLRDRTAAAQDASDLVRRGVVQIHRDSCRDSVAAKLTSAPRHGRRQQDADHFLARPCGAQAAREKNRAEQRAAPSHARAALVVAMAKRNGCRRAVRISERVQRAHARSCDGR